MNFTAFGKRYRQLHPRTNDTRLFAKFRKLVSRFGVSEHFQQRLAKRARLVNEIQACGGNVVTFIQTRCRLVPGARHSNVIFYLQLATDPSVDFVVKDIYIPNTTSGSESEGEEDESDDVSVGSVDSVDSVGSHVPTPQGFHGLEGDILMTLTDRAIAEGFERLLMGYFYDGRFLCMERAKADYNGSPTPGVFEAGVFEIASFLHRHNVRHGDWLIQGMPYNNLFRIEGLKGPVIGDFGNASYFTSVYECLNDLENVLIATKPVETVRRFLDERNAIGFPNVVGLGRELAALESQLRVATRVDADKVPGLQERIRVVSGLMDRLKADVVVMNPDETERVTRLYRSVMDKLSAYR